MDRDQKGCALFGAVVGLALAIWGFVDVLRKQQSSETLQAYQTRMLRGLGLVLMGLFAATVGGALCWAVMRLARGGSAYGV